MTRVSITNREGFGLPSFLLFILSVLTPTSRATMKTRNKLAHKVKVLDKVKKLAMLPDDLHVTIEMAARYYEVPVETTRTVVNRHREELKEDGMKVLDGPQLKFYRNVTNRKVQNEPLKVSRHLRLFPHRAVLRLGMLLRDSEVAKQVRTYLLNVEEVARQEAPEVIDKALAQLVDGFKEPM